MPTKRKNNTKKKIVNAAWRLFYEQGYDDTTVEEIIAESGTSKGSFYHYFEGKDALLSSLSFLFDDKYAELMPQLTDDMSARDKLLFLNRQLFSVIENTVPLELMARLLSTQLVTRGERHLLDHSRLYYKLLRQIVTQGQESGQFRTDRSVNELTKLYALWERGLMYDWSISNGDYSLKTYSEQTTPLFLEQFQKK